MASEGKVRRGFYIEGRLAGAGGWIVGAGRCEIKK